MAMAMVGSSENKEWFDNFVADNYGPEYKESIKGQFFKSAKTSPSRLKPFISLLASCYLIDDINRLILSWRGNPEWNESLSSPIVYYLVNLIVYRNTKFIPSDLSNWLTNFTRNYKDEEGNSINVRKEYLKLAYGPTTKHIIPLNEAIVENEIPITEIMSLQRNPKFSITENNCETAKSNKAFKNGVEYYIKTLYGLGDNKIVIFSGISPTVFTSETLLKFIPNPALGIKSIPFDFPMRSWTIDLRIAVYFSFKRDDIADPVINYSKVVFMMRTDKVCYASPETSWEAEVFKPAGKYRYLDHFITDYIELDIDPNNTVPSKLLVIVVDIELIELVKIEQDEFNKFIDGVYADTGLGEEATQEIDYYDDDETPETHWREEMEALKIIAKNQDEGKYMTFSGGRRKTRSRRGRKTKHIKKTRHSKNARHLKKTRRNRLSHKRRK